MGNPDEGLNEDEMRKFHELRASGQPTQEDQIMAILAKVVNQHQKGLMTSYEALEIIGAEYRKWDFA